MSNEMNPTHFQSGPFTHEPEFVDYQDDLVEDGSGYEGRVYDLDLSVVIALRDPSRIPPIHDLYAAYKRGIESTGLRYEFVFVVEGDYIALFDDLCRLKAESEPIKIIKFARWYGDATALSAGFDYSSGGLVLTLPANFEIDPTAIPSVISALGENDMLVVRRWPRVDGVMNRVATRTFHFVLNRMMGVGFNDLTCGVRLFRRNVVETVRIYGDQHRFFPVLVSRYGYRIKEMPVPQFRSGTPRGTFGVSSYIQRALDLLSIFFLVKFTKKPLRFFGMTGLSVFGMGALLSAVLASQRIFMGESLADRPALLLAVLLVVLGVQLFALGIIGELIIFTHGRHVREYTVEKIVN